ncbi:hypothetical protein ACRT7M_005075, partial [Escherichia coli]
RWMVYRRHLPSRMPQSAAHLLNCSKVTQGVEGRVPVHLNRKNNRQKLIGTARFVDALAGSWISIILKTAITTPARGVGGKFHALPL